MGDKHGGTVAFSNEKDAEGLSNAVDSEGYTEGVVDNVDDLKRRLSSRQIQMLTIGGTIGTALFVSIGYGLIQAGPGSLLIGFLMYASFLACVNNCMAEVSSF
jgi:amino acid transporter